MRGRAEQMQFLDRRTSTAGRALTTPRLALSNPRRVHRPAGGRAHGGQRYGGLVARSSRRQCRSSRGHSRV